MKTFFNSRRLIIILLHLFVWATVFILPAYLLFVDSNFDKGFLWRNYIQIAVYAIIFYINYLWLIPRFFYTNHRAVYFMYASLLLIVTTAVISYANPMFPREPKPEAGAEMRKPPDYLQKPPEFRNKMPLEMKRIRPSNVFPAYNFLLTGLLISGIALGLSFSDQATEKEKQRKEAEKEKLNTELAFLKNQINPHFFFNTLNNIYSLVQISVGDGQKAILQLSKLMRYLLYETEKGSIRISQEIDFIKTYIELMKLRLTSKVELDIQFPESYPDTMISPLLFLPFIENAFKYGVSNRTPSFIKINLEINGNELHFECHNSLTGTPEQLNASHQGIGLDNVRKRLSLLYPGKHDLNVYNDETAFHVILKLIYANTRTYDTNHSN